MFWKAESKKYKFSMNQEIEHDLCDDLKQDNLFSIYWTFHCFRRDFVIVRRTQVGKGMNLPLP
jgi:hypothetical protein